MRNVKLCVNIDHIATLRQARGGWYPDPIEGARICEDRGAHGITVHLREDRRHIQDADVVTLKDKVRGKYNLELALSEEIVGIALSVKPHQVTLVPERREELTTEGGLDVAGAFDRIRAVTERFHERGIIVSLFIEPDRTIVDLSKRCGADFVEFHTGSYCNAADRAWHAGSARDVEREGELTRIMDAAGHAMAAGVGVNAGHGLNIHNVVPILSAPGLQELNIGHSIVSRAIFLGLAGAVGEMLALTAGGGVQS